MTDLSPSSDSTLRIDRETVRALVERLRKEAEQTPWESIKYLDDAATALLALLERVEAAEADAARYRWLREQCDWRPETNRFTEVVKTYQDGSVRLRDYEETFWSFELKDDWRLCARQDNKPDLDAVIDSAMGAGNRPEGDGAARGAER